MNFLQSIEGLRGENLASSVLRYLVTNSSDVRDAFIEFLSDHSRKGPLISDSFFSCMIEIPTDIEDESGEHKETGRIDMIVGVDNAIVGIENKFYAPFQEGQPDKYSHRLKSLMESHKDILGNEVDWMIVVLCPSNRLTETKNKLSALPERDYVAATWESLTNELKKISSSISNPDTRSILNHFIDFIHDKLGFMPNYTRSYSHIRADFEPRGTPLHAAMVGYLWRFFPCPGPRLSRGADWVGYYFHSDRDDKNGWFGFVPKARIKQECKDKVQLIIVTDYQPKDLMAEPNKHSISKVEVTTESWLGKSKNEEYYWLVNFDKSWSDANIWYQCTRPFYEGLDEFDDN